MFNRFSSGLPVGRLTPSPTGAQHVGNARTYLLSWLSIRSRGGRLILRIEDIDSPRVKAGAAQQAIDDWLTSLVRRGDGGGVWRPGRGSFRLCLSDSYFALPLDKIRR